MASGKSGKGKGKSQPARSFSISSAFASSGSLPSFSTKRSSVTPAGKGNTASVAKLSSSVRRLARSGFMLDHGSLRDSFVTDDAQDSDAVFILPDSAFAT